MSSIEINEKVKREISSCYILGRLADESDPERIPALGRERRAVSISQRNENNVVFYLQAVSDEPKLLKDDLGKSPKECYVSFDDFNSRYLQSIKYYEQADKVQFLREHLEGKLILFKPKLNFRNDPVHKFHYNFEIVLVSDDKNEANDYVVIPQVKKGVPAARFERSLLDKAPVQLPDYPIYMEIPEFILCDGYLYFIPEQDVLVTGNNNNLYYAMKPQSVKRLSVSEIENFWDHIKCAYRELGFITAKYASDLRDLFDQRGSSIIQEEASHPKKEEKKDRTASKPLRTLSEADFIARLKHYSAEEGLVYQEEEALVNFHTALKTENIAVLGGMSGTGKTQLALLYAKALGLKKDENLLVVPISPSYTEPSDILGYLNHQLGLFMESETGLVSFLERASNNKNELHMVLFDEMNLGQVEHYFSPFISLLEMPKDQRTLRVFSKDAICHNRKLQNGINIFDNVLFVGTANFDETTKDFSNRMLDRMNVIFLEKTAFGQAMGEKEEGISSFDMELNVNRDTYRDYWVNNESRLEESEISLLDRLHELMREYDSQIGVSFRIAKGIGKYLSNIPEVSEGNPFVTRKTAFDYQIKQRILTKIRGHREQIQELVGTYDLDINKYQWGYITRLLLEERSASNGEDDFKASLSFLEQKAKELTRNGYAL
ncbi:McrB family protein [Paenibacillus sp. YIM B09110]|uniref:McrB family protein n=1 Tax=Paenibacillus sp. YIM B09110 TaxID=3126102 RepID=UPI00301E0476